MEKEDTVLDTVLVKIWHELLEHCFYFVFREFLFEIQNSCSICDAIISIVNLISTMIFAIVPILLFYTRNLYLTTVVYCSNIIVCEEFQILS